MTESEGLKVSEQPLGARALKPEISNPRSQSRAPDFPREIRAAFSSVKYFSEIFLRRFFRGSKIFPSRKYLYTLRERRRTSFSEEKSLRVRDF
jgi:hypothetical protein